VFLNDVPDFSTTALVATIGAYPGVGAAPPTGTVVVTSASVPGTIRVGVSVQGLDPNSTGGIHIHTGTTCDTASLVGGHYWTPTTNPDPWNSVLWTSDATGAATAQFTVSTGYSFMENEGHAIVVHAQNGTRVGCGVLILQPALVATIGAYPGSTGSPPSGNVVMTTVPGLSEYDLRLSVTLQNVDASSIGGVHIHTGTTCASASAVGGHFWLPTTDPDPWNPAQWTSDASGNAIAEISLNSGVNFASNHHHVVTVHAPNGTRIGCGVLVSPLADLRARRVFAVGTAQESAIPASRLFSLSGTSCVSSSYFFDCLIV
jgi:Cu/Zn superoxide dismutase